MLTLIKAFLKAGILGEDQVYRNTNTGTPQGGILSPLLANVALPVLDRPGVSSATFGYLSHVLWRQVFGWLRRKHRRTTWRQLRRQYCRGGWWPTTSEATLFNPETVSTTRYRYRGTAIPSPWPPTA